jgi:hypothetical protein
LFIIVSISEGKSTEIIVSSSKCDGTYTLNDDDTLKLIYKGASISQCKFTIKLKDFTDDICSSAEKFKVSSCDTTVEYHGGSYLSSFPDEVSMLVKKYLILINSLFSDHPPLQLL